MLAHKPFLDKGGSSNYTPPRCSFQSRRRYRGIVVGLTQRLRCYPQAVMTLGDSDGARNMPAFRSAIKRTVLLALSMSGPTASRTATFITPVKTLGASIPSIWYQQQPGRSAAEGLHQTTAPIATSLPRRIPISTRAASASAASVCERLLTGTIRPTATRSTQQSARLAARRANSNCTSLVLARTAASCSRQSARQAASASAWPAGIIASARTALIASVARDR